MLVLSFTLKGFPSLAFVPDAFAESGGEHVLAQSCNEEALLPWLPYLRQVLFLSSGCFGPRNFQASCPQLGASGFYLIFSKGQALGFLHS